MSVKKSTGNMYPWVSHTHTHLRGECPHGCRYCYVQAMEKRFGAGHYSGPLRLDSDELRCSYDTPVIRRYAKERGFERPIIFVEHCNDLFAESVENQWIWAVLEHCNKYDENEYVFQSKNTTKMMRFISFFPHRQMLGTTVETDSIFLTDKLYSSSDFESRYVGQRIFDIKRIKELHNRKTFITVEPVLRMCDPEGFANEIARAHPDFVNIGADSKGHGLPEPSRDQLLAFIGELQRLGVPIRQKTNLERLLNEKVHRETKSGLVVEWVDEV